MVGGVSGPTGRHVLCPVGAVLQNVRVCVITLHLAATAETVMESHVTTTTWSTRRVKLNPVVRHGKYYS